MSGMTDFEHLAPPGPHHAVTDGALTRRAVAVACPECGAEPGFACVVDAAARPYPSTIRIGAADPIHVARSSQVQALWLRQEQ